ncbi:MAG: DUF3429 domain-containing protein [Paracoccaceae bacterium]|jgi:hypothetical protein|nr:DUF3429 domain-containing protein [Marinovum sp.]PDH57471.1 MAG: DUF3429 domain-containing protein [Rhodobacteraceae bacterium MED-G07]|tara:strand:+ start:2708 stop:3163 length:456 start_codon:yes stop_codon:yes gene_type:complete
MILKIPTGALILGLSGVLPFAWGAVTLLSEEAFNFGIENFGARFVGPLIQLSYGVIILCFMSGVLWGFATKMDEKNGSLGYILSVLPALWAFLSMGRGPISDTISLIVGFLAVLLIDRHFYLLKLTPLWWMNLRTPLTFLVISLLGLGIII